ncbi:hypothetical protein BY996DRAFT_8446412 [Phakopsora pachyrhizi]|uniref:USP8 dimerisation domain-containing protein n=1 Tax=Phakopsora pachyrhizi TaxID=170000 RepID=A0AAV0BFW1_PHAPC|nr:hypothetical protein BY996DRAFT_8446412 [Phakopsora pachyrhizi]CAH7684771.1 hypothetical protein PPACK8108_LOCUS19196 [Phakopsora pachyrhizi]
MDSLHPSLSQALPLRGYDADQDLQPPFRAAALGIATFYKKAAENGRKAYSLGYYSALQDVLEYLQAGLDHGSDSTLRSQPTEQRMALTIERVMDYIERRQEALRSESLEAGEDDNTQPIPTAAQQQQSNNSCTQSQSLVSRPQPPPKQQQQIDSSSASHESNAPATQVNSVANESNPSSSSSSSSSSISSDSPTPPQTHTTLKRRSSPRRATSPNPEPSCPTSSDQPQGKTLVDATIKSVQQSNPTLPTATNLNFLNPINIDFSSFLTGPLSQLPHSSPVNLSAHSSRRHRGTHMGESRKGKAKERGCGSIDRERSATITAGTVPFGSISPIGYSHYSAGHFPSGSANDGEPRVLSSIGNKRRYPAIDPTVVFHEPNSTVHRSIRKNNHRNFNSIEEVDSHIPNDDVMMVLGDEPSLERPSKRSSRRHHGATGGGGGGH